MPKLFIGWWQSGGKEKKEKEKDYHDKQETPMK
jgi:hypothetical protein